MPIANCFLKQTFHETVTTTTKVHYKIGKKLCSQGILKSDVCSNHPHDQSFFFQIDSEGQQPWPFGNSAVFQENPLCGDRSTVSWMRSDYGFETQGTNRILTVMTAKHPQSQSDISTLA